MTTSDAQSDRPVRVRFAPSPTGYLHIGGLRTALYNFLHARKHGGVFVLRIEDTDQTRFVPDAEEDILSSLRWTHLQHDEGPDVGGPYAPYRQSERKALYQKYAQQLVEQGHAYYAFDTKEELDEMKERLRKSGNPSPKYDAITRMSMKNSLTLPEEEVKRRLASGEPYVIRLKVPRRETIRFHDVIRGWVSFESTKLDDQVLIKSDGMPTYHLANVVDDHHMEISHVIRGEEWLSSTPKHVLLYRFLGWEPPVWAHLPLILSPTGGKLSKRSAERLGIPVLVRQYREEGYEPEALVNYLALLGWNPGTEQEVFSLEELIEAFSLERVRPSAVQFDLNKLRWFNQQWLRRLPLDELVRRAKPYLEAAGIQADEEYLKRVLALMRDRLQFLHELVTFARFFFEDPDSYDPKTLKKRWKPESAGLLLAYAERLEALTEPFTAEVAERELRKLAEEKGVKPAQIIHPVRLALTGIGIGPSLFELMELLGKETCIRRLRRAIEVLGAHPTEASQ